MSNFRCFHTDKATQKITLADQQADPTSPLYSVKSFDELGLFVPFIRPNGVRSSRK